MSEQPVATDGPVDPGLGLTGPSERRRYIGWTLVKRIFFQIPVTLLVVSILVFWLIQIVPGDPGRRALGQFATNEQVEIWNREHGMTGSFISRYLGWLGGFVTGDWGHSSLYPNQVVATLVMERLGNSALLAMYTLVLAIPVAILIGAWQAYREGKRVDRSLTVTTMGLSAVPEFVIGVVLLIVFGVMLGWVSVSSSTSPDAGFASKVAAMTMPAVALALASVGVLARMVRSGVIETLRSPFVVTARLKGLRPSLVLRRHVLRNALIPSIALFGVRLAEFLGGAAVIETLFSFPGLGALIVSAAREKDIILLEGAVMAAGFLAMGAILLTDIVFLMVDPRIRFDRSVSE